jgi:hypothetical protein
VSSINGDQRLGGEDHMRFVGADASCSSFACSDNFGMACRLELCRG